MDEELGDSDERNKASDNSFLGSGDDLDAMHQDDNQSTLDKDLRGLRHVIVIIDIGVFFIIKCDDRCGK